LKKVCNYCFKNNNSYNNSFKTGEGEKIFWQWEKTLHGKKKKENSSNLIYQMEH